MWLHEDVHARARGADGLPCPPEKVTRKQGTDCLAWEYWRVPAAGDAVMGTRAESLHISDLLVLFTCKLHLFVIEATNPHEGNRDHGGTAASTGSPDCCRTPLFSARSFCLEIRKMPISWYFIDS